MDFVRLAIREARRNATRTVVAVLAVALAAAAPVVARIIPHGYPTEFHLEERQFVGGDLVIWRSPAPIDLREDTKLTSRPWEGSDWQSHALYFMPSLSEGYLAEVDDPGWGSFYLDPEALRRVEGVAEASPYLSIPCVVETYSGPVQAILRGRDPDEPSSSLSMDALIESGRPLSSADSGTTAALVQQKSLLSWSASVGTAISISVDDVVWHLTPVGAYRVEIGETFDYSAEPIEGRYPVVFLSWDRPEIIVTEETFRAIAGDDVPVYQYSLRVERPSMIEAMAEAVRAALGPGYAVYSVPELATFLSSGTATPVRERDLSPVLFGLTFGLSGVVVTGSVYIMLSQQRRKIGLMRVVGATGRDIMTYVLTLAAYITLTGDAFGFAAGKIFSLLGLFSTDMTVLEWAGRSAADLLIVTGWSLSVTILMSLAVGVWASRIPCAEVLRRE